MGSSVLGLIIRYKDKKKSQKAPLRLKFIKNKNIITIVCFFKFFIIPLPKI